MFKILRNKAGQHQVIFASSGKVAATFPNRVLCTDWIERNYPEWQPGNAAEILRKATEKAVDRIKRACAPLPINEQLNASVGRSVWRAR